ncbi:MAG: recombination-associated protein RdgC [Gammaproteobacteria bacterium]|nr:recombination-associated protein RdgC [Gammaproteobacteria bacterium]
MFRNVRFYRLNSAWPDTEQQLAEQLAAAAFRPCGAYTERSTGWESPTGDPDSPLCRRVDGADLVRLRSQTRLLPAAAIEDALETRVEEYRERTQEEPSRREKRKLKQQTRDELLPKALLKSERTAGFVIGAESLVAVNTLSDNRAERFLDHLRAPLGSLDVAPLSFRRPVAELLTQIFLGDAPRGFVLGHECRMQDPSDTRATIRCADVDLGDAAVRKHVSDGMRLTHLGVEFNNVMSCVIDHNGGISKLKLTGMDGKDEAADDDPLARLDAEFVLLTGTLRQLIGSLKQALGGYDEEAAAA